MLYCGRVASDLPRQRIPACLLTAALHSSHQPVSAVAIAAFFSAGHGSGRFLIWRDQQWQNR